MKKTKEQLIEEYRDSIERTFNLYKQIIDEYDIVQPECITSGCTVYTNDGNKHEHTDFIICGAVLTEDFDQFYDTWFQLDEKCRIKDNK